jgi:hypothetical protein
VGTDDVGTWEGETVLVVAFCAFGNMDCPYAMLVVIIDVRIRIMMINPVVNGLSFIFMFCPDIFTS